MKTWGIAISILLLFVLLSSPVVAVSKSDLISFYKGQPAPPTVIPTPTPTPSLPSWFVIPTRPPQDVIEPHSGEGVGPGRGSLSVVSEPSGALVVLDGIRRGETPITISGITGGDNPCKECRGLPVIGTHELKLAKGGYQIYSTRIYVTAGETTSVSVTLNPLDLKKPLPDAPNAAPNGTGIRGEITPQPTPTFGFLEILSEPPGASVFFDVNPWTDEGTCIGITPVTVRVETGIHRLKLTKTGYSGAKYRTPYGYDAIEVTVTEGETTRVSAVLIPGNDISKVRSIQ
jgi:hypothetical protein